MQMRFKSVRRCGWATGLLLLALVTGATRSAAEEYVSASTLTVVALGDSITKGARPARGNKPEVKTEETFVFLLERALGDDYPDAEVVNAGVSSNRTDHAVARLDADVLALKPDAVLIMFGTNDSCWDKDKDGPRLPLEQYEANLRTIITRVREAGGIPVMMTPIPLGTGWGFARNPVYVKQGPNGPITPYVEVCRKLAVEYGTPLVDNFAAWQAEPAGTTDARTTDLCHPNAVGHAALAESIAPVLDAALQARPQAQ